MKMLMFGLEHARDEVDRAELHQLLDELLDLRERTDPEGGSDPAAIRFREVTGKNAAADCAVYIAGLLMRASAGWALNHVIGRAMATAGREADSHQHESKGIEEYSGTNGGDRDPNKVALDRAVVRALLRDGYQSLFPPNLALELKGALRALDFGEIWPIVSPARERLHGNAFTLARFKLLAVEYLNFMVGQGIKKYVAAKSVSTLFGVSPEALRAWQSRDLFTFFTEDQISEIIDTAKKAGELFVMQKDDPDYADPSKGRTETIQGSLHLVCHKFSVMDMRGIGEEYQKALKKR